MIDRFEKFIHNITEIDLYWHRLATGVMKEHGLKGNYVPYFTILFRSKDGMTAAELSSACGKDKSDVSRDIKELENRGFIYRTYTGKGRYRAIIILTDTGKELTLKIIQKAQKAVSFIGGELDEHERECFYRVMDTIRSNMHDLSIEGL